MYSLPPTHYSVDYNYTDSSVKNNVASGLSYIPINNNVFKKISCIDSSSSSNLLSKNNSIDSSGPSSLPVDNIFRPINCNNNDNPSNLPARNNVFQTVNISSSSSGDPSNLTVNNNVFMPISNINSSSSSNVLEENSSNIPATKVLEEMYETLKLDIPPVYTFRQEIITQKFFCSAGFMNRWYDTEEAFPNQERAKEAAAQSLLKIIMASGEYERYLRAKEERHITNQQVNVGGLSKFLKNLHINPVAPETMKKKKKKNKGGNPINIGKFNQKFKKKGNKQFFIPRTPTQKLSKRQRKKLNKFRKGVIGKQDAMQDIFCPVSVSKQENESKKVKFNEKILVLGQDDIPRPSGPRGLKSIMSQKNQSSSSQYDEPVTYQMFVREFMERNEICIPPSKLLDELCFILNIPEPKYDFCNDGYRNFIAEVLVGDVKYIGERAFWYIEEAKECVAELAFNVLYIEIDENTRMKFKEMFSFALLDRPSNMPDIYREAFILPQQRHKSYIPAYPDYNDSCMQQFRMPSSPPPPPPLPPPPPSPPPPLSPTYHNIPMGPSRSMFDVSSNPSIFDSNPFSEAPFVSNLDNVQQTHKENPTQIQVGSKSSTINLTVSQQQNESITQQYPYILHKLSNEKGWGAIDYQHSKTLKGYKCTCYIRKLKFTSNPCIDKDSAKNQAAKIALLALPEYSDCEI